MDFNRTEPTCYRTNFLMPVPANKMLFFLYVQCSTTRNAPYVHTRLDRFSICAGLSRLLLYFYPLKTDSSVYLFFYNTRKIRIVRYTCVVIFQNNYVFLTCINTSLLVSLFLLVRHLFSVNLPKLRKSREVKTLDFPRQNIAFIALRHF